MSALSANLQTPKTKSVLCCIEIGSTVHGKQYINIVT